MIKISIFKNQPRYYGRGKRKKKKSAYEWILIDEMNKYRGCNHRKFHFFLNFSSSFKKHWRFVNNSGFG